MLFHEESDVFCNARRFSSRVKRNIDGTYRWPRPLEGGILITNSSIRFSYIVHGTVALQLPAAEKLALSISLFPSLLLSRRCPGDLHEIGDPSAGWPVDLSLEWKSRIEIFSSARRFCTCFVRSSLAFSTRSIPIRVAFLSTRRVCTRPKNIGFAPPPASEISANLMRRTGIFPTLPITPLIRFYLSAPERISERRA